MRCELKKTASKYTVRPEIFKDYSAFRPAPLAVVLLAVSIAIFVAACGSGGSNGPIGPPPPAVNEIFIVDNFSGDVSAFSAASGKLAPISGSSASFPPAILQFAVEPTGTFLAVVNGTPAAGFTLQVANIGAGDKIILEPLASIPSATLVDLAISSQGIIAVTNEAQGSVQLMRFQNNLLSQAAEAVTGKDPRSAVFSSDGTRLYVGNSLDGTISVFNVSMQGAAMQLAQTATLPVAAGELPALIVRVALSSSGTKIAATTDDGRLFVGDVSAMDGTLSGFTEAHTTALANLEEVLFDPSGQNVYTADQDNGGIFGFTLSAGGLTPIMGSPFSTGTLPGGPTGMAFNSAGDLLYAVISAQSAIFTFSRNMTSGSLTATGDMVGSGGLLGGRIFRVSAH